MAQRRPLFSKCCFCFNLRTGSKVIAYIYLVTAAIGCAFLLLLLIPALSDRYEEWRHHHESLKRHRQSSLGGNATQVDLGSSSNASFPAFGYAGDGSSSNGSITLEESDQGFAVDLEYEVEEATFSFFQTHHVGLGIALFFYAISLTTASLMLHGLRKGRSGLLLPWVVESVLYQLLFAVQLILMTVFNSVYLQRGPATEIFLHVTITLICYSLYALKWYFISVIVVHYFNFNIAILDEECPNAISLDEK